MLETNVNISKTWAFVGWQSLVVLPEIHRAKWRRRDTVKYLKGIEKASGPFPVGRLDTSPQLIGATHPPTLSRIKMSSAVEFTDIDTFLSFNRELYKVSSSPSREHLIKSGSNPFHSVQEPLFPLNRPFIPQQGILITTFSTFSFTDICPLFAFWLFLLCFWSLNCFMMSKEVTLHNGKWCFANSYNVTGFRVWQHIAVLKNSSCPSINKKGQLPPTKP